ncbi:MAG: FAD:protein FMN transferase [Ruminiclostridium sp.]|nr:FAD:protein FMN transferase [Ruminiclostridium sp.]
MKKYINLFCALVLMLGLGGCSQEEEPVTKANFLLDTYVQISLYDDSDISVIDLAFQEITRLEDLLSVNREGSELDRLAKAAGKEWVEISPETQEVLLLAKEYADLSGGLFDVTSGPLIDLWDINGEGHYPTQDELDAVLPLISSEDLLIEDGKAYLAREGMEANLGAIAKGYIADKVKELLLDQGVESAIIDLGRNVLLIGDKSDGVNFNVGVQDPNQEQGILLGLVSTADTSVVTSGINERYFTYEGVDYHHILDPFTGFPADNDLASVTILSSTSAQGDALSTTCLLLGTEKGMELIESLEGVEAFFITKDGTTTMSPGFEAIYTAY